ncbi:MAG: DUF6101 family protein [Beijerinckiaceae bacterium]
MAVGQEPRLAAHMAKLRPSVDTDRRAEDNRRTVHFENERIVIVRRIHGVAMRVTMPVNKYDGIGVLAPNPAEGANGFRVMLVHADPDLSVKLYESGNPLMVDAALTEWSAYFGLPVLDGRAPARQSASVERAPENGDCDASEVRYCGAVSLGASAGVRRRGGVIAKRRPRLYARRRKGDAARMSEVHRGEKEIIARN